MWAPLAAAAISLLAVGVSSAQQSPAAPPAPPAAAAPAPAPPVFATTKVEGTDNVYIFRYGGYQSMFVTTPEGVIATDPISYLRPQVAATYIDEIKKITQAPIRYVIYSHHHYDHASGGKRFKDLGATFIAHKNAKARLEALGQRDIVLPDEVVEDSGRTITLGGTVLELHYAGRNHSDNMLVMRLPKEKLIFTADWLTIDSVQFRNMPDNASPIEWEEGIKKVLAMDWDRMIPAHPGPGGRLGTRQDTEAQLAYMQELSAEVKKAADAGKCWDTAMREIKLPKYEGWAGYAQGLPANIERYCYWWSRGY